MYVHPVLCCSFPIYRYLLPTYCDEYRGAFSGPSKDNLLVLIRFQLLACTIDFNYAHLRFRRSRSPRVSPRVWSRKNSYCYVGVWLYYATFSGPKRESAKLGAADYKILLYATPKSTIKLISSFTTCIISFSLKAQRYLSCCAQVCVCMCVRVMYELCVSYQVYIKFVCVCTCMCLCVYVYMYTRVYANRVLLLFFIYTRLSPALFPVNSQFRFPIFNM